MSDRINLSIFKDFAVDYLLHDMAQHEGATIPAPCVGGLLLSMTKWDKNALSALVDFFKRESSARVARDLDVLLGYVPPKQFSSERDVIEWTTSVSSIQEAVNVAARWGFWNAPKVPGPGTLWNAVLIAGLEILSRHVEGQVAREDLFALLYRLGLSKEEVLKSLAVQKELCCP